MVLRSISVIASSSRRSSSSNSRVCPCNGVTFRRIVARTATVVAWRGKISNTFTAPPAVGPIHTMARGQLTIFSYIHHEHTSSKQKSPPPAALLTFRRSQSTAPTNTTTFNNNQRADTTATRTNTKQQQTRMPMSSSLYDESDNWEDWLAADSAEYANAWEGLDPLDYPPLDISTRRLIQQLQDLYHRIKTGPDRPTIAQCRKAMEDLANTSLGGKKLQGRAQRADAILKTMKLFDEGSGGGGVNTYAYAQSTYSQSRSRSHYHFKEAAATPTIGAITEKSGPTDNDSNNANKDTSIRRPYELPRPNHDSYFSVLKLYAKTSGGKEIPLRCQAIVDEMQHRSEQIIGSDSDGSNTLDLEPNVVMWNQVLSAWAVCRDPEKAYHAVNLLQQMRKDGMEDASSYGHVLRACAFSVQNDRSKKLGMEIAIRVWNEFHNDTNLEATSYMYTFFLQACQHLEHSKRRDEEVEIAFLQCAKAGRVNAHVLLEFKKAASNHLYQTLVGKLARDTNYSTQKLEHGGDDILRILQRVPIAWTRHANVKRGFGW